MACGGESYFCRLASQFPAQPQAHSRIGIQCGRWPFETLKAQAYAETTRKRTDIIQVPKAKSSEPSTKKANLFARGKEKVMLPSYNSGHGRTYHISEFLSHPSGTEAILNTRALQSYQSLDSNTYRCKLPKVQLLNFEAAPVMDLRVTPTNEDCKVEMLSCKFEGSEVVERQNDYFSASMINYMTWEADGSGLCLDVNVDLNVTLEVYTPPFTFLPVSVVESPGNLLMQGLVDRLLPLLLQQLVQDYNKWVKEQHGIK